MRRMAVAAFELLARCASKREQRSSVLAEIDDADLSESGRRARREALHEIRERERRAFTRRGGADTRQDGNPDPH
jgi:hypothetical protein